MFAVFCVACLYSQDGTNALMAAASNGHLEAATSLVKAGAALDKQNSDGHSALMFAYNGRAQVCCLLQAVLTFPWLLLLLCSGGGVAVAPVYSTLSLPRVAEQCVRDFLSLSFPSGVFHKSDLGSFWALESAHSYLVPSF